MFRGINRASIFYDLVGLAHNGIVHIGRESDSTIRLDCQDVPFLLSRKHATVRVLPDGSLVLRDINSTNGTYVAREGEFLRRMKEDDLWVLQRGDLIGFGGPETIVARSEAPDVTVANPFLFKYTPLDVDEPESSSRSMKGEPQLSVPAAQGRARKFSEIDEHLSHDAMDVEDDSTSHDQGNKKAKTITARDMASLLANHLMCSICHDWLAGAHALSCGHMFCGVCLATWLTSKQSCPECRKPTAGVPVRCRNVDNTISELLSNNLLSPNSKREQRRKTVAWGEVGDDVAEEWACAMQQRRHQATAAAAQHIANLTAQPPAPHAPAGQGAMAQPAQNPRVSEHGAPAAGANLNLTVANGRRGNHAAAGAGQRR